MRFDGWFISWNAATAGGRNDEVPAPPARQHMACKVAFDADSGKGSDGHGARPAAASRKSERHDQSRSSSSLVTAVLVILAASAAVFYATMRHSGGDAVAETVAPHSMAVPHVHKTDPVAAARFARPGASACDGRMRCSQMNSCAEAKYFLANCPSAAAEMDSNLNGIPCDQQWCTAGAANKPVP